MHVEISDLETRPVGEGTVGKVDRLTLPFARELRAAYIAAGISDEESATLDILTDLLVYAELVKEESAHGLAERAARAAHGELFDYQREQDYTPPTPTSRRV